MQSYNICGLKVRCDFRYPIMQKRAEKYLCADSENADIEIPFDEAAQSFFKKRNPALTSAECEVMHTTNSFYRQLLDFDGFMLHSSAVAVDGKAYLFTAPSGTGKSTHTQQWLKLFGERAEILNDDKPAIIVKNGEAFACGTPWSGKSDLNVNAILPLQGICILSRSEENYIRPAAVDKSLFFIMNQTLRPSDPQRMDKLLTLLDNLLSKVNVWKMGCSISTQAAELAFNTMSR